jgi:hypothetical protein
MRFPQCLSARIPLDTLKTRPRGPNYQKIYYDASKDSINQKLLFRGPYQGAGSIILITILSCRSPSRDFSLFYDMLEPVPFSPHTRAQRSYWFKLTLSRMGIHHLLFRSQLFIVQRPHLQSWYLALFSRRLRSSNRIHG